MYDVMQLDSINGEWVYVVSFRNFYEGRSKDWRGF